MFRQRAAFIWRFLLWSKSEINAAGAANQVYGAHAGGPHIGQFNRCLGRKLQPALHHGPGIAGNICCMVADALHISDDGEHAVKRIYFRRGIFHCKDPGNPSG